MTEPAVQELLNSPRLALYVQAFERVLAEEQETRARFYDETTEHEKAEFINGEVIVHAPARKRHNEVAKRLLHLLDLHVRLHDLGFVGYEKLLITLTRNDYEPDLCFFSREKSAPFTPDQTRFPAPDFIAEVLSPSTEARDRGVKFEDYAAHGVREYWLLDPVAASVEQYVLEQEHYRLRMKSTSGQLESVAVAGFALPVQALFDDAANLQAVRRLFR